MRAGALAALTLVALVGPLAAPAAAHSVSPGVAASNYRSAITAVTPRLPGVDVAVVDGGMHVQLINRSAGPVVVLGYTGEPYLRVTRSGVWQNTRSPATYLNTSFRPGPVTAPVDPHAPPV